MNEIKEMKTKTTTSKQIDRSQALRLLEDELWPIADKLEKAMFILGQLDQHFADYNPADPEQQAFILWEHQQSATRVNIIQDYVKQAKDAIGLLTAQAE